MNTTLMARICNDDELIAQFGQARLLRNRDGRYELRGGTPDNHAEAREWASLFMHEAFFAPPQPPRARPALQNAAV